jgi:GNAT superfamily N-acetyltransferase
MVEYRGSQALTRLDRTCYSCGKVSRNPMVTIRPATATDIPDLAELWHEKTVMLLQYDRRLMLLPDAQAAWSKTALGWLEDPRCCVLVAEEGRVVGYIAGWKQDAPPGMRPAQLGAVSQVAVDAHGYYAGVGRLLVDALRVWFAEQGIERMMVWTPHRLAVEQAFWRSLGATEWMDILWL